MSSINVVDGDLSNKIAVRDARAEDAEAIGKLYVLLTGNPAVNVKPERIASIAAHEDHHLLVAEVDDKIIGTIMATFCMDAMFGEQPFTVVENVIVDPGYRGLGIGAELFAQVEALSLARHSSKIMLLSSSERLDAHRFFEQLGYQNDKKRGFIKYRRQLSE